MTNAKEIRILREYQYGGGEGMTHFGPHSFDLTDETVEHIIAALERDRWISVEERLPEINTSVLVYAIGNADGFWGEHVTVIADRFLFKFFPSSKGEEEWSSPWQYFHTDYKITHWKPLPEPPKEDKP